MNLLHSSPSEREFRADETMIWILCKYGFFRTLFHLHQIIDARGPEFASLCSTRFMFVLKKFMSIRASSFFLYFATGVREKSARCEMEI